MQTETLDKLYLEWSQFTQAKTMKELALEAGLAAAQAEVEEWKLLSARETTVLTNECNRLRAESAALRVENQELRNINNDIVRAAFKRVNAAIDQARKEGGNDQ